MDPCYNNGGCGLNSICVQPREFLRDGLDLVQCVCEEGYIKHPNQNECIEAAPWRDKWISTMQRSNALLSRSDQMTMTLPRATPSKTQLKSNNSASRHAKSTTERVASLSKYKKKKQ
eukprot:Blabericola_migrator_1__6477@NODE_326_length_9761_cov_41_862080_g263_i0_p5_GENE_NODE_326_length_9761_cov_41_862080_g263_i0NODE_326_length_9761_cov_41_862080_g263_i0_p5_ORF_typecomplete_len117_score10_64EGF_3/PF12947_7/0_015EGF/PF00008_27/0_071Plasmod_Pvs28/PF06247_11/7_2e03Plasmod_Pvs28/PF06247_11/0_039cEGF/PF12662_7/0_074EB/PF01683_18/0_1S_locus_glycop/PF00954_20/0_19S_locus_glycop/PF00954_20/1_1e03FXa_inhibition/PF14670_6/0_87EGF_Tenascin/PF18720_1/3_8e02EGF_Tenascin/PF18720_1/0_38TIL/PF01826_